MHSYIYAVSLHVSLGNYANMAQLISLVPPSNLATEKLKKPLK